VVRFLARVLLNALAIGVAASLVPGVQLAVNALITDAGKT
jgi:hypothetical protein